MNRYVLSALTEEAGPLPPWFYILLAANALAVLIYWLFSRIRGGEASGGCRLRCVVMLLCPLVGPLFFLCGWVYYRLFFRKPVDLDDVIFSKNRSETFMKADEEKERDLVPLEEAIAITDQASTRALMMDVVRRDISHSLSTISMALGSEDSEVSHYAAAVLQEAIDKLRVSFQKLYRHICELEEEIKAYDQEDAPLRTSAFPDAGKDDRPSWKEELSAAVTEAERENAEAVVFYREETQRLRTKEEAYRQALLARDGAPAPEEAGAAEKLAEEMEDAHSLLSQLYQVLRQRVLSTREQIMYINMMQEMCELIDRRDVLTAYELESVVSVQLRIERYEICRAWCLRSAELYPNALSSYTSRLKLYYALGEREAFFRVMDELKSSEIPLDHETLEMIRVFL